MSLTEKECSELLPWYLNGTLSPDERQALESALDQSEQLKQELEKLKLLRDRLPEQENYAGSDLGWRRLQKQIRSGQAENSKNNWKTYIAIAAMLVIAVQVGLFNLMQSAPSGDVQLLGGRSVGSQGSVLAEGQLVLQIQFGSQMSWQDIKQLINELNGSIVQGPSALGVIQVRLSRDNLILDGRPITQTTDIIQWLKAQPGVEHAAVETAK